MYEYDICFHTYCTVSGLSRFTHAVGVKSVNKAMSKRGSVLLTLKVRESCEKRSDSNCLYDDLKEQTSPWNHHLCQLVKNSLDFFKKNQLKNNVLSLLFK